MKFNELQPIIIKWAEEKEILSKATPIKQLFKTLEEITELLNAIENKNTEEIVDALGDIVVTLIIYSKMKGISLEIYEDNKVPYQKGLTYISLLDAFNELLSNEYNGVKKDELTNSTYNLFEIVYGLAIDHKLDLWSCLHSAYNVIKNRKGKMINGQFIKSN